MVTVTRGVTFTRAVTVTSALIFTGAVTVTGVLDLSREVIVENVDNGMFKFNAGAPQHLQ